MMKYCAMGALLSIPVLTGCTTNEPRNQAVAEFREPEIVCEMAAPAGTRIKRRVCHERSPTGLQRDRTFGRLHDLPMDKDEL